MAEFSGICLCPQPKPQAAGFYVCIHCGREIALETLGGRWEIHGRSSRPGPLQALALTAARHLPIPRPREQT